MVTILWTTFSKKGFLNENFRFSIQVSLKYIPNGLIDYWPALVLIMAWCPMATSHYMNQWWNCLPRHILPDTDTSMHLQLRSIQFQPKSRNGWKIWVSYFSTQVTASNFFKYFIYRILNYLQYKVQLCNFIYHQMKDVHYTPNPPFYDE